MPQCVYTGYKFNMEQLMLWRVHPETVNLVPLGKQSWFDSKLLHQFLARSYRGYYVGLSIRSREFESPTSRQVLW